MSKSVLVVGGSYFIGKKIVDVLIDNGYEVFTLNRGTKPNLNTKVKNIICNRDNPDQMKMVLKDYLFNFVVDVSGLNKNQVEIMHNSINHDSLEKYVFISSSAVYDISKHIIPFEEGNSLGENKYWTDYGTNKIEAEDYLTKTYTGDETQLIILRPPYVYGEDNYAQRESFIFNHIIKGETIIVPNDGHTRIQFIYTKDLANIIVSLLQHTLNNISIFNVGNKNSITFNEWIEACQSVLLNNKYTAKPKILHFDYKRHGYCVRDFFPFFNYDNVLDVTKINEIYNIETNFDYGLQLSLEWYQANADDIVFKQNVTQNEQRILSFLK